MRLTITTMPFFRTETISSDWLTRRSCSAPYFVATGGRASATGAVVGVGEKTTGALAGDCGTAVACLFAEADAAVVAPPLGSITVTPGAPCSAAGAMTPRSPGPPRDTISSLLA